MNPAPENFGPSSLNIVGVNQPYYFPYPGYFGLIASCETFVVYDDVEYTKKGWINRNRILTHEVVKYLSLPLERSSDFAKIKEKVVSRTYNPDQHFRLLRGAYGSAPYWSYLEGVLPELLSPSGNNLFEYLLETIRKMCEILEITSKLVPSSQILSGSSGAGLDRLRQILDASSATHYVNLPGGRALYRAQDFSEIGVRLGFADWRDEPYPQGPRSRPQVNDNFEVRLSILDLLANLGPAGAQRYIARNSKIEWCS